MAERLCFVTGMPYFFSNFIYLKKIKTIPHLSFK